MRKMGGKVKGSERERITTLTIDGRDLPTLVNHYEAHIKNNNNIILPNFFIFVK